MAVFREIDAIKAKRIFLLFRLFLFSLQILQPSQAGFGSICFHTWQATQSLFIGASYSKFVVIIISNADDNVQNILLLI